MIVRRRALKRIDFNGLSIFDYTAGSECERSVAVSRFLLASESLRQEYDDLKRRFDGKSMAKYRDAKADFVERVLDAGRRARLSTEQ